MLRNLMLYQRADAFENESRLPTNMQSSSIQTNPPNQDILSQRLIGFPCLPPIALLITDLIRMIWWMFYEVLGTASSQKPCSIFAQKLRLNNCSFSKTLTNNYFRNKYKPHGLEKFVIVQWLKLRIFKSESSEFKSRW